MKTIIIRALILLVSIGWAVPAYIGVESLQSWVNLELMPLVHGKPLLNSFPLSEFGFMLIKVSIIWLCVVIGGWALYVFKSRNIAGS